MLSYKDFTRHFDLSLFDKDFQKFLTNSFSDLTEYNILESDYITSEKAGIDLGFTNNEAVYDDDDIKKAGNPTQTKEGYADFLNKNFLVDNYKVGNVVITFDYDAESQTINFIQVRDNNLVEHLKL